MRGRGGIEVYTGRMIRYAITSGERERSAQALLADAQRWADEGVEFVQLREKWMKTGELVELAKSMMEIFRSGKGRTRLFVHGRADVALAVGADGVHLTSEEAELSTWQVRELFEYTGAVMVSLSCHSVEEVEKAAGMGVDLILFGPIFEKRVDGVLVADGKGVGMLRKACDCAEDTPLLALGGVTKENVGRCVGAGARGVAGIRLFA